jgi:aromatic ring-opening dioxygenase catalytic subunit (LigB family)
VAEVVFAAGASHAPGLTGWFDKAGADDQRVVRDAYRRLREDLTASRADLLILVGNDHVANARVYDYPDFTVGLAPEHVGPHEWFRPWLGLTEYRMPGDPAAAGILAAELSTTGLDVRAAPGNLRFDDNLSVPVALIGLTDLDLRLVPILQNCTVPPVPDERACYRFGQQLGRTIARSLPAGLRVGLLGSGGLSHEPGGPRYLEIDEKFDRWWLDLLAEGDHERVLTEATFERMEQAGAGGTAELLSWQVVMGAVGERPCQVLGYACVPEWRCGIGAVRWEV